MLSSILAGALVWDGSPAWERGEEHSMRTSEVSGSVEGPCTSLGSGGLKRKTMGKVRKRLCQLSREKNHMMLFCSDPFESLRTSQLVVRNQWPLGWPSCSTPEPLWLQGFNIPDQV